MPRRRDPKPAMRSRRGPPRSRPRLPPGERDRRLAEEVLYLHSLWRRGPPAPAPTQSRSAGRIATERKRRRLDAAAAAAAATAELQDTGLEWVTAQPPPNSSPKTWPEAAPASSPTPAKPPPPPPTSPGALAQREALRAAAEFFSNRGSDDDEEDDDEDDGGSESEGEQDAAGFITGLFERDAALRGHYEQDWEEGQFACMACAGGRRKPGRRFRGCVALVQHARAATRYGRPRAHRALAAVVCRVLGWDIARLPSIVIDPRGTLGQALAAEATQPAKDNDDTGDNGDSSSDEDEEEEEIEKENGYPSADGDEEDNELESSDDSAQKEDVDKGMEDSRNNEEEEEEEEDDIELDNGEKSAEKEELEENARNFKEISENEVLHNKLVQEVNASKDDSLNQGNNEEVHWQEITKEYSEQENTNNMYLPGSKDRCKDEEHCKEAAVQEKL